MLHRSPRIRQRLILAGRVFALAGVLIGGDAIGRPAMPPDSITPDAITHLRHPADVILSPDGTQVVFELDDAARPDKPPKTRLWTRATSSSGHMVALPGSLSGDHAPEWSPDGRMLAWIGKHDGPVARLWLASSPGAGSHAEARLLATPPGDIVLFRWAPDGKTLLVLTQPQDHPAASGAHATSAQKGARLFLVSLDGRHTRALTVADPAVFDAAWAPDGRSVILRSGDDPGLDAFWYRSHITVIDLGGHELARLPGNATAVHPSFSPDGRHIVYGVFAADGISGEIRRYDYGDHTVHPIGADWSGSLRALHWNADGKTLTALGIADVTPTLAHVDAASGHVTPTTPLGGEPYEFSMAKDGTVAVIASRPDDPDNVWVIRHGQAARVTDLDPQVHAWRLGTQRIVHWQSKDGTSLSGLLVLPPGTTRSIPLLVQVHGGPYDAWSNGWLGSWHDWARLLAANGIATFMPNPRGSDGRGPAFARATRHDWGGIDAQDILDGVDALERDGTADAGHVAIGGWSYGGFMAAWLAGHSDRFRTAIDGAGPTQLSAMALSTDVATGFLPPYFGDPVRDHALYDAHSPLFAADTIHIPMLLMHGAADARVPPDQSLMLFNALRARGRRVERVTYVGAPHWFGGSVSPATETDVQERVLDWLRGTLLP
ncbi:S9 family peptidase [Acidomonas methanolica]|uniref:S9 family peptidase n=1 Tax=Acidomonas methanolica TaxID=437 RepID=UPI00211A89E1|nr:S9 family peptidase [Acidomonas methanolica]MCQ9156623.1 S9 family peptidase [Acidomonas methanolica]